MSSHWSPSSSSKARAAGSSPLRLRPLVRTIVNRPLSFWPWSSNLSSPSGMAVAASRVGASGSQVPQSQTMTSPAPYCFAGMTPSKSKYSIGWSSTWTAMRRIVRIEGRALRDRPRDEDARDLEPEVVVETGRAMALDDEAAGSDGPAAPGVRAGAGSGVFAKSRLRRYSSRGM